MSSEHKPFVSHDTVLPETTVKAIILGILLSIILSGANAYLGLFAGMTVSASIPAAVISMALFRFFKKSNILENNIVQTSASAGESLAAGVIFTFPALVLMGYWSSFNYLETTLIALCGGILGVCFTIPLRSALIVRQKLLFPEGIATAEVLKSGEKGSQSIKYLVAGGLVGALIKLAESGFKLWDGLFETAGSVKGKLFAYFGLNLSPALVAVGYIVGLRIASLVFLGGVISWWFAIPIYLYMNDIPLEGNLAALGGDIWNTKIRYLGAGAMLIGGVWAIISIAIPIKEAIVASFSAWKERKNGISKIIRTEYDTPISWVILITGIMIVPIAIIYLREIHDIAISSVMAMIMVLTGFLFSAVAGYMAGLVGSSNNPISGVTIATILTSALILIVLMGSGAENGPAAAILIGSVVCCAAAIAGDNMQDLKSGYILGATPYRQQVAQIIGVVAAAFVMAPILDILHSSNGIGSKELPAPQATLMMSIAKGVFGGNLPWEMIIGGVGIGLVIIIADQIQRLRGSDFRIPILAVAVGIYLPFELDSAIMLGGIIAFIVERYWKKNRNKPNYDEAQFASKEAGLLTASGFITGEALIGIIIALIVFVTKDKDVLTLLENPIGSWPGALLILGVCVMIYWFCRKAFEATAR